MTEEAFRSRRRQRFLTEAFLKLNRNAIDYLMNESIEAIREKAMRAEHTSSIEGVVFKDKLNLVRLAYTAGEPIESLPPLYADAIHWFGQWHAAEGDYLQYLAHKHNRDVRFDSTPLEFENLSHFQLALDVVSLGLLLGQGDLLRKAIAWMDSERGSDMLFEAIVEPTVADPRDVEEFFHVEPYDPLLDAIYTAETPAEASTFVKKYLDGWYKAFEGVPWHNGHLITGKDYLPYFGYWAFEAAAVCVIHNIDDSLFRDHLVYPKDLADWARANNVLDKIKPDAGGHALRLRCEAGNPCPQGGYWFTPAKAGSRRRFSTGETMPEIKDSPWGSTIWYWDEQH
jgi:hypothetical protein